MKLRNLIVGAGLGVGAVAGANRLLADRAGTPSPPLGRATEAYRWRGFDISYTEAGDPADPDLLLLHGINAAGSSAEFEACFDGLADDYHVLAPDLPGFGLSDRPPLLYSPSLYVTFVTDFIRDLTEAPTVVASSLTAAYTAMAVEGGAAVEELVLVCPTDRTVPGRRVWLRSLLRTPLVGEAVFNLIASEPSLRYFQRDHGVYDTRLIDEEWTNYRWQLTHQPGARYAPASFVSGFLDPEEELAEVLEGLEVPTTIAWGRDVEMLPVERGHELAEAADARLVVFDDAMLLPHYEHPAEFVDLVGGRLEATA